ncbi:MAG TPA: hypothetical protein VGA42_08515 [Gemmatimonadales bacterium]
MSYFSLRKRDPEPESDLVDEDLDEAVDEPEDESPEEEQTGAANPLVIGILGPGNWIAARFGTGTAWGVHAIAVWAIGFYGGWTAAGILLAWLAAVLLFVPREHLERWSALLEHRDGPSADDALEAAAETIVSPLVTLMWRLIGEAPGVHVKTLAELIQEAATEEGADRAAVRAAVRGELAALGIPLRASVRDAAGRVNEGVHRADLKAWQEALHSAPPASSPGARSSPVATAVTCDEGKRRTPVATPLSRLRRALSRGAV